MLQVAVQIPAASLTSRCEVCEGHLLLRSGVDRFTRTKMIMEFIQVEGSMQHRLWSLSGNREGLSEKENRLEFAIMREKSKSNVRI
jgi:hypothetical protein